VFTPIRRWTSVLVFEADQCMNPLSPCRTKGSHAARRQVLVREFHLLWRTLKTSSKLRQWLPHLCWMLTCLPGDPRFEVSLVDEKEYTGALATRFGFIVFYPFSIPIPSLPNLPCLHLSILAFTHLSLQSSRHPSCAPSLSQSMQSGDQQNM